jgi:branched-chain amino acid transport system substrate-binding protein
MPICKCDNSSAFGRQNEAGRVPLREKRMRYPSATLLYPVLFIAALAASARPGWTSDDVVKIGIMADMNGPLSSASGRGSVEAARMAAEEFGWSINGKRIEIISADHQNKPDLGAAIARQWFDVEHVDVIGDLSNSAVGFAIVEIARPQNKIILVSGPGSSDFTGKACAPTSFHWTWDTYAMANGAVSAIFGPDADTWFLVVTDLAFGHAFDRDVTRTIEKHGGKILGRVRPPFAITDFSSFLLNAQSSGAKAIALGTAGQDTVNIVKQAAEFGLTRQAKLVPLQLMIDEVKTIGLSAGQGSLVPMAFYHDKSAGAKQWSLRYFERMKAMPTQIQAGTYSAVRHYLLSVRDKRTTQPLAVATNMRKMPINDIFATDGYLREDGRMVHDMYLTQIKMPAESHDQWDLVKIVRTIPGSEAFRPLSDSECPAVRKSQ